MSASFEDTVKNLLKMPPKPHKPTKGGEREKESGQNRPDEAGPSPAEGQPDD